MNIETTPQWHRKLEDTNPSPSGNTRKSKWTRQLQIIGAQSNNWGLPRSTYEKLGFCGASSSCSRRTGCFGTRWLNWAVNKKINQSLRFTRGNSTAKTLKTNGLCDLQQPKVMADTWANLHKSISLTLFSHSCGGPDCRLWHLQCRLCLHLRTPSLGRGPWCGHAKDLYNNGNNILWGGACGWMV